jgi:AcrR family transcriptional regulator
VFNYFPRKEDLFLDRLPEAVELITQAVRGRPEGEEPLAALRRLVLDLLRQGHPLAGVGDHQAFWQVILDSPALQARLREWVEELETRLGSLLAEATGAQADAPWPRMAAAMVVTVYRTANVITAGRILAGARPVDVAEDHAVLLNRSFEALEQALASLRDFSA